MASVPNLRVTSQNIRTALQDAVRLRLEGAEFDVSFELGDARTSVAQWLGAALLQQFPDHDARRAPFEALAKQQLDVGGKPQKQISLHDPNIVATMRNISKLARHTIVHSVREYESLCKLFEYRPRARFETPAAPAFRLNSAAADAASAIVVFAPGRSKESLSVLEYGLHELRLPVRYVLHDSEAGMLASAKIIVDATTGNPGNAIALARLGVPLCCAVTSGAVEYLTSIALYEPWDATSVYRSVTTALGMSAPVARSVAWPATPHQPLPQDGPLVTIAIRTYNRPELLRVALQSVASQTYRTIEAIVVNDAGCAVDDVVSAFPFARLIDLAENSGGSAGSNVALEAARGEFIGFLDDDDVLFGDHIARLVAALHESGAGAAQADTLSAYYEPDGSGTYRIAGYHIFLDQPVEPTDFHVSDTIGPMSVLVRTEVAREAGGFDSGMPHAHDWEFYLKLSRACDIVHVPHVTAMYSIRSDASNMMRYKGKAIADAMERMIERLPLPDRPFVEAARREGVKQFAQQGYSVLWPQPPMRLE